MNPGEVARDRAYRILVVDDEETIRALLAEALGQEGYEVTTAADGQEALEYLENQVYDLVITDLVMPRADGVEVLLGARRINPQTPVIVMTGYPTAENLLRFVNLGASDFITKPFNLDVMRVTVAKLLEARRAQDEGANGGGSH